MRSLILQTAIRYLVPLQLMFSIYLLLGGHQQPGGGFVGGLIAASAFSIYAIANGVESARRTLRVDPRLLIGVGLSMALSSGLLGLILDGGFLVSQWGEREYPGVGTLSTPLLFDTGVYTVVIGVVLLVIFSLMEEEQEA
ncbi:Na+/H+ antiporter subunit B [Aggregatilinea lenta]|uniref:Na+/H+ antiporter subunit B n=1 Tax=Aggregatilinea lenta TaxID=913108 RepID=UPI000E5A9ADB|nr:Na+/H+ antiporter subunit B [Aggregatilinea lenta]